MTCPVTVSAFPVAAEWKVPEPPVRNPFSGCLKDIQVNHVPVPITDTVDTQGMVSLNGCPDH